MGYELPAGDWDVDYYTDMGGVGHASTTSDLPPKRKKKVLKRPIGFTANIDELYEDD